MEEIEDWTEDFTDLNEIKEQLTDGDIGKGKFIYDKIIYEYEIILSDELCEYPDIYYNELKYCKKI